MEGVALLEDEVLERYANLARAITLALRGEVVPTTDLPGAPAPR